MEHTLKHDAHVDAFVENAFDPGNTNLLDVPHHLAQLYLDNWLDEYNELVWTLQHDGVPEDDQAWNEVYSMEHDIGWAQEMAYQTYGRNAFTS